MKVQVSESNLAGNLKAYLDRTECVVQVLDARTLEVTIPRAAGEAQALRQLTLYLGAWRAMNPGARAILLD
jgi:hypothetical protein